MEKASRKALRLRNFDYASPGAYFVTVCTKNKEKLLAEISVGAGLCARPVSQLTEIGQKVEAAILYMDKRYAHVTVDKYVVMPNHIHLLLTIRETGGHGDPPLHKLIGEMKSYTTHQFGAILWQRGFYDHVIRGDEDYKKAWEYIETNPARWEKDRLYE